MAKRERESEARGYSLRFSRGYLKRCRQCSQLIYIKLDNDGTWRPYESWAAGNVEEDEWRLHECCGSYSASRRACA
jgi:hypothetical protein